jgi:hypothetical protein
VLQTVLSPIRNPDREKLFMEEFELTVRVKHVTGFPVVWC